VAHDKIKLNYEQAEQMAKTFKEGSQQLQQTMQEMKKLAEMLQEGGLLGRGGTEFVNAIQNNLCPSITKMGNKFVELEGDVKAAIAAMRQADAESTQQFR
jgi:WXG100 family type VII secretion target